MLAAVALVAAACGGGGSATSSPPSGTSGPHRGGVYRTAIESFGFTDAFDPTGEYLGSAFGLYSEAMLRTLVGYNHVAGAAGDTIVPDLATNLGTVSPDGLTYTFHLKPGVKFGPPVDRPITSKDVLYAFQRINTKSLVAQYGFYYDGVIKGMTGDAKSPSTPISGISTPDSSTIVFHLAQPTGDFLYRLTMPATAPIPSEVAKCFTTAGGYGRDVVSSGPYMILGADKVNDASCKMLQPMAGFDPTKFLKLVRNPDYSASTDSPAARQNFLNGIDIEIDTNTTDIFNKIQAGQLDGSWASAPPPEIEQQYLTNPALKPLLKSNAGDRTWYISMNLLTPPFDDIHVRKAVNDIIDKASLQKAWGGPVHGQIATHVYPPTVLPSFPSGYNPYPSAGNAGNLAAAEAEMKLSKYDPKRDGLCDVGACKNILMVSRNETPWTTMDPVIQEDLAKIGIDVKLRELDTGTAYTTIQTVDKLIPIAANAGWGKDYADPYTFAVLFKSSGINCTGQINYSEIGMTSALAKQCGVSAEYNKVASDFPSLDSRINDCEAASGTTRNQCWVSLDQELMTNVVPWVPYLWATNLTIVGKSVTQWQFDQFSGYLSWCHIAVNNDATVS
jgi:peptide/nickel transport system substrate-binding protein